LKLILKGYSHACVSHHSYNGDMSTSPMTDSHLPTPNLTPLRVAAYGLVVLVGTWYLLGELTDVLRPLLLAVFLGYDLPPWYNRLRLHLPVPLALGLLAGGTSLVLVGIAAVVTTSLVDLSLQLPELQMKLGTKIHALGEWLHSLPTVGAYFDTKQPLEQRLAEEMTQGAKRLVGVAALALPEALAAGLYLLFLLMEAGKFPVRVRRIYVRDRAEQILDVFGRINAAVISYLKAKVTSSLCLALPAGMVLMFFGVKFAILWAVLTFVCNFIPYVGSVVAYSLPVGFAFLMLDDWQTAVVLGVLLFALHATSASFIEPMLLGRAVGLSPIVILAALSVWGVRWGLPGMFLAVPLTMVVKIVLEHVDLTRSVSRLIMDDGK